MLSFITLSLRAEAYVGSVFGSGGPSGGANQGGERAGTPQRVVRGWVEVTRPPLSVKETPDAAAADPSPFHHCNRRLREGNRFVRLSGRSQVVTLVPFRIGGKQ